MPMFILISGYFSKSDYIWKKFVKGCLIPYFVFDLLFTAFSYIGDNPYTFNLLIIQNGYRYILCIGFMRLLHKLIKNDKLLISIIATLLLINTSEDSWRFLAVGRVFLLIPMFILGTHLSKKEMNMIRKHKWLFAIIGILCLVSEYLLLHFEIAGTHWATHNHPESLPDLFLKYAFMCIFTVGELCTIAALLPEKPLHVITQCGKNSITVYPFRFFIVIIVVWGINHLHLKWNTSLFIGLLIVSVLIAYVLTLSAHLKFFSSSDNMRAREGSFGANTAMF